MRQPIRQRPPRLALPGRGARARGFTLLEVMVSLGILAVSLMALGDMNGGAARMHAYATRLTVAVQLARGKMLDVQQMLIKDGLSDYSKEYHGTFSDEGWSEFSWKAEIIKPDFDLDGGRALKSMTAGLGLNATDITSMIGNIPGLGGLTGGGAPPSGGAAGDMSGMLASLGPLGGMIDGQMKQIGEVVKNSLREIKLTISWKAGSQVESFQVVQHIVQMPEAAAEQQANATANQTGAAGTSGATGNGTNGGQPLPPGMTGRTVNTPPLPGSTGF